MVMPCERNSLVKIAMLVGARSISSTILMAASILDVGCYEFGGLMDRAPTSIADFYKAVLFARHNHAELWTGPFICLLWLHCRCSHRTEHLYRD